MGMKVKLQINYKSGKSVEVKCDGWKLNKSGPELTLIELTEASPRPLFFGLEEIESIWEIS